MTSPAKTPDPPYYAVIFTSVRSKEQDGYAEAAKDTLELAARHPGFLGFESARQDIGISVSYWDSLESIRAWKENVIHRQAQRRARSWYKAYRIRVCRVEREHGM